MSLIAYSLLESCLIFFFTAFLVRAYAHSQVSWMVKAVAFLGWFLGFSIIFVLPLDILAVTNSL